MDEKTKLLFYNLEFLFIKIIVPGFNQTMIIEVKVGCHTAALLHGTGI